MTPDEFEHTIEFILQQEARAEMHHERFRAQLDAMADRHRELGEHHRELSQRMDVRDRSFSAKVEKLAETLGVVRDTMRDLSTMPGGPMPVSANWRTRRPKAIAIRALF